jgi:signal transduction histidine kinase
MNLLQGLARRPGAAANAALAVVLAALLAREAYDIAAYHRSWLLDVAVGAAAGSAALLRGRGRARAAAAALAVCAGAELASWLGHQPGQPGGAAAVALLVLVGSAARVLPLRPAAAIAAGALAVGLTSYGLRSQSWEAATHVLAQGWAVAVAGGLWLRFRDARHQAAIEAARRSERLDLARELHDAAAHHITGIVIQAQAARIAARRTASAPAGAARPVSSAGALDGSLDDVPGGSPGAGQGGPRSAGLDDALAGIEAAAAGALASMRQVIGLLRDGDDAGRLAPGPERLADLVGRFAGRGPAVRLRLPSGPDEPAWPPEVTTTVYRVVQEALTNVTRHAAGAREVTVTLAHDQRAITVEVTDDAPPAGPPRFPGAGGYGLVGMRERVEALGGTLHAGPRPPCGWSVRAALPAPGRA